MVIIKTANLTKKFKDLVAVKDVSLEIEEKECFGLLGPNGAGKTTLIRMLTALSPPTRGDIVIMGRDLSRYSREIKAELGMVPQVDNLDDDLNVVQNLRTFARYFAIPKDEAVRRSLELLKAMQLEDKKKSKINELSGGMKRRLLIARGLINNPRILVLDEPSIGLDPQARHMVWQKLKEMKARGGYPAALHPEYGGGGHPLRPPGDNAPGEDNRRGQAVGADFSVRGESYLGGLAGSG
ncbi:MAG: ABC transporter ATP-binding protein [Chloroflexota bacterium]